MKSRRLVAVLAGLAILAAVVTACGADVPTTLRQPPTPRPGQGAVPAYLAGQTRTAKAQLIEQLKSPPQVVVFGGSRAMRVDPAYIRRRTGLTAFNAAVTQARPEDTWALLNLLHARFPSASFRFLWVIHCDEFIRRSLEPSILLDPVLARYFPAPLIKAGLQRARSSAQARLTTVQISIPKRGRLVYAPDGYVLRGFFSNATPPPNGRPGPVAANIRKELAIYATHPVAPYPRSVRYFQKDLALMESLSPGRPVVVAAPFDRRIYAATLHHGWGARHRRILALLARLRSEYRFKFLDLSRATAHGFTPDMFYDGIHLTPQGTQRVVDLVLRRFPHTL